MKRRGVARIAPLHADSPIWLPHAGVRSVRKRREALARLIGQTRIKPGTTLIRNAIFRR